MKASGVRLPRVVIAGGGFGGLYAAKALRRVPVQVTLLDRQNHHLFRPMLYQVATGLLSANDVAAPIRSILRDQQNVEVLMAEVTGVDTSKQIVRTQDGDEIPYDYLILATGIHYNYFGHENWKELAPGLDSIAEAQRIRSKILYAFEEAERIAAEDPDDAKSLAAFLTFVVVGAGTAGVEMAGTIAEMSRIALSKDFRHIDPRKARILLFEAAPRILPTYPEKLSEKAHRHLEELGVNVHQNTKVEDILHSGVFVGGKNLDTKTIVWTAGVVASPAGRWLGAKMDPAGRILVNPDLSVPEHPNIFAIGDTASVRAYTRNLFGVRSKEPQPIPGVAQPAIQGGRYVASVIRNRVLNKRPPSPFWYWNKGDLAIVGRTYAVADLNVMQFSGFLAWLLWAGVHIYFLIGFGNRLIVTIRWAIAFLTKHRGARLIARNPPPSDP